MTCVNNPIQMFNPQGSFNFVHDTPYQFKDGSRILSEGALRKSQSGSHFGLNGETLQHAINYFNEAQTPADANINIPVVLSKLFNAKEIAKGSNLKQAEITVSAKKDLAIALEAARRGNKNYENIIRDIAAYTRVNRSKATPQFLRNLIGIVASPLHSLMTVEDYMGTGYPKGVSTYAGVSALANAMQHYTLRNIHSDHAKSIAMQDLTTNSKLSDEVFEQAVYELLNRGFKEELNGPGNLRPLDGEVNISKGDKVTIDEQLSKYQKEVGPHAMDLTYYIHGRIWAGKQAVAQKQKEEGRQLSADERRIVIAEANKAVDDKYNVTMAAMLRDLEEGKLQQYFTFHNVPKQIQADVFKEIRKWQGIQKEKLPQFKDALRKEKGEQLPLHFSF